MRSIKMFKQLQKGWLRQMVTSGWPYGMGKLELLGHKTSTIRIPPTATLKNKQQGGKQGSQEKHKGRTAGKAHWQAHGNRNTSCLLLPCSCTKMTVGHVAQTLECFNHHFAKNLAEKVTFMLYTVLWKPVWLRHGKGDWVLMYICYPVLQTTVHRSPHVWMTEVRIWCTGSFQWTF